MSFLLNLLIFLPAAAAAVCILPGVSVRGAKGVALGATLLAFVLSLALATAYAAGGAAGVQFLTAASWIPSLHAEYRTGADGLSLPLVVLTTGLSVLVVLASWRIERAPRAFLSLYLVLLTALLGVFLALDLLLFYLFFELTLLPMYFLIGVWGGPGRRRAAIKFFLYTLAGSLALLVVMVGLCYFTPEAAEGTPTWIMAGVSERHAPEVALTDPAVRALFAPGGPHARFGPLAFWLALAAFLVKLPAVPLHTWLPDAHVEAPTPVSMILAGVLLKLGGYGLMRIAYPFFPDAARQGWLVVASLGVLAILYGALCAMAQTDWKRLVAYSSVSHMGYVTLGLAVLDRRGFDGAYFQMIAHGVASALMFFLVGVAYERAHHREMARLGGLWLRFPAYGGWSLAGFAAGMGLPFTGGFVGELLVLLGVFAAAGEGGVAAGAPAAAYLLGGLAALGTVLAAGYILPMFRRVYLGPARPEHAGFSRITPREYAVMAALAAAAVLLGVAPLVVLGLTGPTLARLTATLGVGE